MKWTPQKNKIKAPPERIDEQKGYRSVTGEHVLIGCHLGKDGELKANDGPSWTRRGGSLLRWASSQSVDFNLLGEAGS